MPSTDEMRKKWLVNVYETTVEIGDGWDTYHEARADFGILIPALEAATRRIAKLEARLLIPTYNVDVTKVRICGSCSSCLPSKNTGEFWCARGDARVTLYLCCPRWTPCEQDKGAQHQ